MKIGFSTGSLYKTHDRLSPKTFDVFRKIGCTAIELMWYLPEHISELEKLTKKDLEGFEHVSIHLPEFGYLDTHQIKSFVDRLERVHEKLEFAAVVLHPDKISDWSLFQTTTLPIAIENMDARKAGCQDVDDLQKIFKSVNAKMVLDIAHVFDNDPSMQLGKKLVTAFEKRICEVHISGYNYRDLHDPIHLSKQTEILNAIPSTDLSIIIESVCLTEDEVKKEFDYISSYLKR